jgi:hypothetical protein
VAICLMRTQACNSSETTIKAFRQVMVVALSLLRACAVAKVLRISKYIDIQFSEHLSGSASKSKVSNVESLRTASSHARTHALIK